MVDEEQIQFAFIFEDCRNSSSQEELLTHDKIAREDEECSDDYYSLEMVDSGEVRGQLDGGDEFGEMIEGEFVADDAELEELENLGFQGEQKGEISGTKLEGFCDEEREIEHELKKCEVSPVVDCGGKMVIEGGEVDDGEEIGMFEGDLEVEKVKCLRSGDRGSGDYGENSGGEGGVGDDVDMESGVAEGGGSKRKLDFELIDVEDEEEDEMKKKMEFAVDNEVIIVKDEEEESDVGKERGGGEGSGNAEGDKKRGDDTSTSSPREEKRRKRELPRSLFGLVWGEGSGGRDRVVGNRNEEEEEEEEILCGEKSGDANRSLEEEKEEVLCGEGNGDAIRNVEKEEEEVLCGEGNGEANRNGEEEVACGEGSGDANRNEVIGNDRVENGLEEASEERNRDGISRGCEEGKMSSMLDVLRFLAKEKSINDGGKINFVETVKRRGMTFPRSRFLPEEVEDDDDDDEEEEE